MAFWEKGYLATTAAIILAGSVYFYLIWQQSLALGTIAPPGWTTFGTYLAVATILSVGSFIVLGSSQAIRNRDADEIGAFDERDDLINLKSMTAASYVTSIAVYATLVWFLFHSDGNLLFHSIVGALMLGELSMCLLHVYNYNRAY